jgi:hypothetical protein
MHKMKSILAALTLATCIAPAAADATVIDFTTYPTGGNAAIDQSYGDIAGMLDVTYEYSLNGGSFVEGGTVWSGGYYGGGGDDTRALVAPFSGPSIMRITLQALGGNTLTSFGVSLSYWTGVDAYPLSISAFGDGNLLFAFDNTTDPGLIGVSTGGSYTTVTFELGLDWNVGYHSVNYELNGGPSPIPLPAAGWLMLAGLGALAVARRTRR